MSSLLQLNAYAPRFQNLYFHKSSQMQKQEVSVYYPRHKSCPVVRIADELGACFHWRGKLLKWRTVKVTTAQIYVHFILI